MCQEKANRQPHPAYHRLVGPLGELFQTAFLGSRLLRAGRRDERRRCVALSEAIKVGREIDGCRQGTGLSPAPGPVESRAMARNRLPTTLKKLKGGVATR